MNPVTIGLDLAKNVFHVHVADASAGRLTANGSLAVIFYSISKRCRFA
jgi:hypothetical protein